jgi:CheY-like chemotaxis protein
VVLFDLWDHCGIGAGDTGGDSIEFPDCIDGESASESGVASGCDLIRGGVVMQHKKILIAYEEGLGGRSLATYFHGKGYRVETVKALSEMIRKVRNGHHQVLLLGDEVEGLKACDVVSLLKKVNSRIQVIMISSEEPLESVRRLRGAGIFYQAMKPVDLEEIRSAVQCAFEKIEKENEKEGFFSFLIPKLAPA